MRLKKAIAIILCAVMMCTFLPILPQNAQAATLTKLDPVKAGDDRVTCYFTDVKTGDNYEVYLNNVKVNSGSFDKNDVKHKSMYFMFGLDATGAQRTVKKGDNIRVYMTNANGNFEYKEVIVDNESSGETPEKPEAPSTPVLPVQMLAAPSTIKPSANAQVKLSFDAGYVAHPNDQVKVSVYDSKEAKVDVYDIDLPDVYTSPVVVPLKNSAQVAYYIITFQSGTGLADVVAAKVTVDAINGQPGEGSQDTQDDKDQLANAVDMVFHYPSSVVALGESVTPTIQLKNAKGEVKDYNGEVIFSYSGEAIAEGTFDNRGRFTVKSNKEYEDSKILVTAMIGSFHKTVELTVQASGHKLVLTPDSVGIGGSRTMNFQLYNYKDERIRLNWQPTMAKVVFRLPEGVKAKTFGTATKLNSVTKDGSGSIQVSSDTITDAEIYIVFSDYEGHYYETGSAQVHFTEASEDSVKVVLNINSYEYSVNDIGKRSDTTPVIKNNRTFIPARVLTESIGGTIEYDPATQKVTAVNGDTTVVMRIGDLNYTVNGETKQSDVAPYINKDNRTMVPVRLLCESFKCVVTPVYGADGTTKQVIIEK